MILEKISLSILMQRMTKRILLLADTLNGLISGKHTRLCITFWDGTREYILLIKLRNQWQIYKYTRNII